MLYGGHLDAIIWLQCLLEMHRRVIKSLDGPYICQARTSGARSSGRGTHCAWCDERSRATVSAVWLLTSAAGFTSFATCVLLGSDQVRCCLTMDALMFALLARRRLAGTTSENDPLPMTTLLSCGGRFQGTFSAIHVSFSAIGTCSLLSAGLTAIAVSRVAGD